MTLGIGQRFEFGADFELAIFTALTVHHLGAQQQSERLGHQHHLESQVAARRHSLVVAEADTSLGNGNPAWRADVTQKALGHGLAEQVDAFVHDLEVIGQGAVAFTDMAQQVL